MAKKLGKRNRVRRVPTSRKSRLGYMGYIQERLDSNMAAKKRKKAKRKGGRKKTRSPAQRAATKRMLAANKRKGGGKRAKKRSSSRKRKSGPTAFQRFLMNNPAGAKKKMGW